MSQCSDYCHFSKFDCDAKTYTADINTENSDCFNEEKQIYHTVNNNNSSKKSKNEENNLTINFVLLKSSQCVHECQQCHKKYFI